MPKEMLINVSEGEECRIALLENDKLEELYMERTSSTSHVGNIYKGRVTNVEPSIQAAFVDFGLGRNGFLHISDLMPTYFGRAGGDIQETVGRKMSRRDRPPIQRCLRRGDQIIVQIIKEGIGTKGPTLSTYLSIPGRILVMMPGMGKMGVSRKIEDEEERRRLRTILDGLKPPKDVGFIIRTAGIGKSKTEIQRDLTYLTRLWQTIDKKLNSGPGPMELYTEGDLVTRTVRDVFTSEIDRIIVDSKDVAKRIKEFIKISAPRTRNKVELYEEPVPLFHKYGIEKEIELMYSRHVPLPSGGSLVIDSTEAVVAIDVNSGKFRDHADAETTAFRTDMEAADEIPRQLRLRDLGGVIICDFIDLRYERHRRELEKRLHDNLRNDRAKTKVLRMSQFGIIEMTRQRMRPSLKRSIYFDCPHCKGSGLVKTPESMSLDVMRRLAIAVHDERVFRVELAVCPDVGMYVLNKKRAELTALEAEAKKKIIVRQDPKLGLDEMKLELFDSRDGMVYLDELGMRPSDASEGDSHRRRHQQPTRQGGGRRDNRDRNQLRNSTAGGPPARGHLDVDRDEADEHEDRFDADADADNVEADVEQREDDHDQDDAVSEREEAPVKAPSRQDSQRRGSRPQRPAAAERDDADAESHGEGEGDDEGHVTDVEDGHSEPIGERDQGFVGDDNEGGDNGGPRRRRRRRRGGRGRNRSGGGPDQPNQGQQRQPMNNRDQNRQDNRRPSAQPATNGPVEEGGIAAAEENEEPIADRELDQGDLPDTDGNANSEIGNDASAEPGATINAEEGEQRPRRRRRRGGRGRRRGGAGSNRPAGAEGANEASDEASTEQHAESEEPGDARGNVREDARGNVRDEARPVRTPPPPAAPAPRRAPEPLPVVKTGSTDRHLVSDEPIIPEPVRRPRSYRDLDAIPDDLD